MKRILLCMGILFSLIAINTSYANSGLLFKVKSTGTTLNISTVAPNHQYLHAGIQLSSSGYTIKDPSTQCLYITNGYCVFATSDTNPASINLSGPSGSVNIILCLDADGPLSCQHYNNIPVVAGARFAYIANVNPNRGFYNMLSNSLPYIFVCSIDPVTQGIDSCTDADPSNSIPDNGVGLIGLAMNAAGTMVYATNAADSTSYQYILGCTIDPNSSVGAFSNCAQYNITTPTGYESYYGTLALTPDNNWAYVVDSYTGIGNVGRILACPMNNGVINSTCQITSLTSLNEETSGIVLDSTGTTAYIGNTYSGIVICSVSGSTFSNCITVPGDNNNQTLIQSLSFIANIALNKTGSLLYITNSTSNSSIYKCSTTLNTGNSPATFTSCTDILDLSGYAQGITLNKTDDVLYVTNYNTSVTVCSLDQNGDVASCVVPVFNLPDSSQGSGIVLGY